MSTLQLLEERPQYTFLAQLARDNKCLQQTERLMTECKDICPTEWKLYGGQALPKQTILTSFSFSKEMVSYIFLQGDSYTLKKMLRNVMGLSCYICFPNEKQVSTGYFQNKNIHGGVFSPHIFSSLLIMRKENQVECIG